MWTKLAFVGSTVLVSLILTFAPVVAQQTDDVARDTDSVAGATDDSEGPDLGWLGLIGLVGLGGLLRRDRDVHRHDDRASHR